VRGAVIKFLGIKKDHVCEEKNPRRNRRLPFTLVRNMKKIAFMREIQLGGKTCWPNSRRMKNLPFFGEGFLEGGGS